MHWHLLKAMFKYLFAPYYKQQNMKQNYLFKKVSRLFHSIICLAFIQPLFAQQAPALPDTSQMTYNQISQRLNVVVFPAKGQSQQKQKEDEFECYKWAIQQSGIDPMNLPDIQAPAPTETSSTGEALKGAAAGAAAGAAIGAIVGGGAGEGAAIGGITGVIAGRRRGKKQMEAESQQTQASVSAQQQEIRTRYLRAFAGCIEGKGYSVK